MQMKCRSVIAISIRLDDLPIGDLGVFHEDVSIGDPLAIRPAHEPFDGEPMIGFVRGQTYRWKGATQTQREDDDREFLPSLPSPPQNGTRPCRSRKGFKQQNASPRQASPVLRG